VKIKFLLLLLAIVIFGCKPSYEETIISLDDYVIEDGFKLQMIASEPLLVAPVAMDFDNKGRMWVVEMSGYMQDLEGNGENDPIGSIKILEDLDNDGVIDHTKVFMDSLVLPRALAHVYGGLLYAEPPNLWFVETEGDVPGTKIVVDSAYAAEGNPEHQPNGLMLNVDNWIYNAKSKYRYQRRNGKWIKEATTFRGQWGISHDNFGRLYYNDNSRQLLGDHMLPNRLVRNKYYTPKEGVNKNLTDDQRVYPLFPAFVNRGYEEGTLNKDSLLINFTAACGPLVYRGGTFPEGYDQNVFVCAPEVNLIKRNVLTHHNGRTIAKQAWEGKEFLASTDPGFRPVSLYNGPNGSMFVIDMHRGVIGHHAYLSPYLKKKIVESKIDTLVQYGRILKIDSKTNNTSRIYDFKAMTDTALLAMLGSTNGWERDRAQHYIIYSEMKSLLPELKEIANNTAIPLAQVHALYAMEGLNELTFNLLREIPLSSEPDVLSHTVALMEAFVVKENVEAAREYFINLMSFNDVSLDIYIASTLGTWATISKDDFFPSITKLMGKYRSDPLLNDAILSGVQEVSSALKQELEKSTDSVSKLLTEKLVENIDRKENNVSNRIYSTAILPEDNRTSGYKLFKTICVACHGTYGEGIAGLAPPLMNSEYVSEPLERLGLILLHGLKGPVHVNGKLYEVNGAMPGLIGNESLSDKDISDIISYVTNAFSGKPRGLKPEKIEKLRNQKSKSGGEYTETELLKINTKKP